MLAHHTTSGCNLIPGDLLATGTISGPEDESRACLAEITELGTAPIALSGSLERLYLLDGDGVVLRGCAERDGFVLIGFGECRGTVLPAHAG